MPKKNAWKEVLDPLVLRYSAVVCGCHVENEAEAPAKRERQVYMMGDAGFSPCEVP